MTLKGLKELLSAGETERVEFKESTGQRGDACETLCAFLNKAGGTVVFGVTPKGRLTGQLMDDTTRQKLFAVFQRFEPAPDIEVECVPVDETHTAIVCHVDKGNCRPYVYDGRPYKRVQSSTTVMSQEEYERMLKERGGFRSDWERLVNPTLTLEEIDFDEVKKTARMAVQVGRLDSEVDTEDVPLLLKKFKLMRGDRLTNGAAVLFGNDDLFDYPQCEMKMARFKGTGKNEFGDERREEGNIFKLLSAATQFCFKHLSLSARVIPYQIERVEQLEIPPVALREAVLNALVHRQYSKRGSVSLAIYDDRLEVTSPGGFPPGKTVEQIISEHESEPRNERIAHVLYLRKTIETWGRGFDRIREECEKACVSTPVVAEKNGYVRITFARPVLLARENGTETEGMVQKPGLKNGPDATREVGLKSGPDTTREVGLNRSVEMSLIRKRVGRMFDECLPTLRKDIRSNMILTLSEIAFDVNITIPKICSNTKKARNTIKNSLSLLKELGFLYRIGSDRGGHWYVVWKEVGK